jgi:transposase-like protein
MSDAERPPGPDVQQCPSCASTAVLKTLIEARKVWFVCPQCNLRWSIADRRSLTAFAHDGPERRRY